MEQHQGTTVLITGGAGGIGAATASAFRAAGATVHTADLAGRGADLAVDVTDASAMRDLVADLDRIDVVVANAGVGVSGLVGDLEPADWQRSIDVNIAGTVNTVLPAFERMRTQGSGDIVLVASLAGILGTPLLTPYAMTKAAIVGLGASLLPEAARHGIRVTTVCPGPIDTALLDSTSATPGVDVRRYLTATAGPALSPQRLADVIVGRVGRTAGLVTPGRARTLWRLHRIAPRVTAWAIARGMGQELTAADREVARPVR